MHTQADRKLKTSGLAAAEAAMHLERSQIAKYHTKGGHGFSAEDANAFADKVRLRNVEITGTSNEANGPDRIVNGIKIQTKYYQTAKGTVDAAFHRGSGIYRYEKQLLEVPSDQYEECVRIIEQKIQDGRIPGITDPKQARSLVKKGTVTYWQARNIARAGNIESLKFDAKTQAVTSSYTFAASFAVGYARAKWNGKSNQEAASLALKLAIEAGTTTFITDIITAQALRSRGAAIGAVAMRSGVKTVSRASLGKAAIEKVAQASLGKAVYGAAAMNHVAKLLRSNVITSVFATTVMTTPDVYRAMLARSISWSQFSKNLAVNAAGVASGVGGWMGGAVAGTAIGGPVGGIVGGITGSITGGSLGSAGCKFFADKFVEDDANKMIAIVQDCSEELVFDSLLSDSEMDAFAEGVKKCVGSAWLRKMYQAGNKGKQAFKTKRCTRFARKKLEQICDKIIRQRKRIRMPALSTVQHEINELESGIMLTPA